MVAPAKAFRALCCVVAPVPPLATANVPASVTAPVVAVEGVRPVVPPLMLVTPAEPTDVNDQAAYVPEPPTTSTSTVMDVPLNAVIVPSMKFDGVVVYATRTREPTVKAVFIASRLVVKVLLPVPISTDDEDDKP